MNPQPKIGVFLPTFSGDTRRSGAEIAWFARRAEALGFDSLWATDHLLHGSLFYRVAWLEPLLALTHAAAVTERMELGTSILVMPVRHPVVLAKQITTLQALSDDRYILGAGTGWDQREFEAVGVEKKNRGVQTDECIDIVRRLIAGEKLTYDGRFYRLDGVEVGPAMERQVRVWVAGGRQLAHERSPESPAMARAVLQRIGRSEGWISRPTSPPEQIQADIDEIHQHFDDIGRSLDTLTIAHENFLHFVPTDDPRLARKEQARAFGSVMSDQRPFDYFEKVYLTGTQDEIVRKLEDRLSVGVRYIMLHTLEPSIEQLELWAEHLIPKIRNGDK
jgi:alkanesulfonate monooxygenase SsuD/methylene tetrahydromethanopterin reductase-like flavin-dependent oxidoreductase (luciferase family)